MIKTRAFQLLLIFSIFFLACSKDNDSTDKSQHKCFTSEITEDYGGSLEWSAEYDANNNAISYLQGVGKKDGFRFYYNANNKKISKVEVLSAGIVYEYRDYSYDGEVLTSSLSFSLSGSNEYIPVGKQLYEFDNERLIQVKTVSSVTPEDGIVLKQIDFFYDENQNLIKAISLGVHEGNLRLANQIEYQYDLKKYAFSGPLDIELLPIPINHNVTKIVTKNLNIDGSVSSSYTVNYGYTYNEFEYPETKIINGDVSLSISLACNN